MKTGIIIQARIGSTRLPQKVMMDLYGKPILGHVVERVKQCRNVDEVIVATTVLDQDNIIAEYCRDNEIKFFRGSEEDVLSRYYLAAMEHGLDCVVRITSDCPVVDPHIVDKLIDVYKGNKHDVVTNINNIDVGLRTFPRGLDAEVFSFSALRNAEKNAAEKYQREHVTIYIYENSKKIYYYTNEVNLSKYRWTVDTQEDFELMLQIYKHLYKGKHDFYMNDIVDLMNRFPELEGINRHIEQKKTKN